MLKQSLASAQIEPRVDAPAIAALLKACNRGVADDAQVSITCVDEQLIIDLDIRPVLTDVPVLVLSDLPVLNQRPERIDGTQVEL